MARGLAALGDGRFDEAYGHFRRLHDPADPAYQIALRLTSLGDLVEAATHSGRTEQVRPIVAELAKTAAQTPAPVLRADLRLARAMLARDDDAEALFEAALRADLTAWPLSRSRTQLAYGEWLRRHRKALESRDHLRAARDMFDALGAIPWGERPPGTARRGGDEPASRPGRRRPARQRTSCRSRNWRPTGLPTGKSGSGCTCRIAPSVLAPAPHLPQAGRRVQVGVAHDGRPAPARAPSTCHARVRPGPPPSVVLTFDLCAATAWAVRPSARRSTNCRRQLATACPEC